MWIGTNDLGGAALLDHAQVRGKTLVDYTSCVFSQLGELYHLGARRFVLLNIAPLELAPLYSVLGTPGPDRFWLEKGYNLTDIAASMTEEVAAANEIFSLHAQLAVKNELWGSKIAILNTNGLIRDIYNHPELYLNGTAPLNVTGYNVHCGVAGNCFDYRIDDRDAFLWYDALHPSEQASRVVAREFKATVEGKGKWATYW
ncbi:hypothetical protein FN846DRAFT_932132 [Sphaerosporella brunnea]|uniref:GDSL lipase/esterase n=1 Tax=Sphaerosporella brunnea TaxID=1250544 RepID=A0A5J5F7A8_9PEZI|nr:hypothetical protein FN846DRAFT_932132 [Sphaerosporella brunnea]